MRKLRIAQLSTPLISVPPENYGGTELVVHNVTEELVKRGHEVTLFAPGTSKTLAKLVSPFVNELNNVEMEKLFSPLALKLFWTHSLPSLYHAVHAFEMASEFDIIHNHFHYIGLFFSHLVQTPVINTYHGDFSGALKSPIEKMILEKYKNDNWIAISESQKANCSTELNFVSVIHHGIPIEKFEFNEKPEDYLVWLGRVTPKKGISDAISAAKKANKKLVIAGVVHPRDEEFFKKEIEPQIDNQSIFFKGGLDLKDKVNLFKNARVLLYPVTWEEPFGLVMIEAMATGTPVIAYNHGAVPEIVQDQQTGYLLNPLSRDVAVDTLTQAVNKMYSLSENEYKSMRFAARKRVEENFTVEKMVDKHEEAYQKLLK